MVEFVDQGFWADNSEVVGLFDDKKCECLDEIEEELVFEKEALRKRR